MLTRSEDARAYVKDAAARYRTMWKAGDPDGLSALLVEVAEWMRSEGINPFDNDGMLALQDSDCTALVNDALNPPACDPDFLNAYSTAAAAIDQLNGGNSIPTGGN